MLCPDESCHWEVAFLTTQGHRWLLLHGTLFDPIVALQFMGCVRAQPTETPNLKSYCLSDTFHYFYALKYIQLESHTTRHTHFSYRIYVRAQCVVHGSIYLSPIHWHRDSIIKIAPSWSHSNDCHCGLPMTGARTCLAWIHLGNFRNGIFKSILHIRKRAAIWDGEESSFGKDHAGYLVLGASRVTFWYASGQVMPTSQHAFTTR